MSGKTILFGDTARRAMASGLESLADAVKVTLGPRGRNVAIEQSWGSPLVTKDGVTVAKAVDLEGRFANLAAQMVKEVASRTADVAGDGTTTATVLAHAIFREGAKLVAGGIDPMQIKRGIEASVNAVVAALASQARPVQGRAEIAQIGAASSNGDTAVGELIAEAMERVGGDGVISIEASQTMDTALEVVEGFHFDRGYLSAYFVTDAERMEAVLEKPYLLVLDGKLSKLSELLPLLELVAEADASLLVIAEDLVGDALATLVVNTMRGRLRVCAVKSPGFGTERAAVLEDIATMTGGTLFTAATGATLDGTTLESLGRAERAIVDKDSTTILQGAGAPEAVAARVGHLRARIDDEATSEYDREKLQSRMARLVGGVAVISVGAATEAELNERKARVEDALHATRAAVEEGIVPGGGIAYLRARTALATLDLEGEQVFGVQVIHRALEEPLRQIAANCGVEGGPIVYAVAEASDAHGWNAATQVFEDLVAAGIIDPVKVVRVALQNAASVAALMLTTEAAIAEPENERGPSGR